MAVPRLLLLLMPWHPHLRRRLPIHVPSCCRCCCCCCCCCCRLLHGTLGLGPWPPILLLLLLLLWEGVRCGREVHGTSSCSWRKPACSSASWHTPHHAWRPIPSWLLLLLRMRQVRRLVRRGHHAAICCCCWCCHARRRETARPWQPLLLRVVRHGAPHARRSPWVLLHAIHLLLLLLLRVGLVQGPAAWKAPHHGTRGSPQAWSSKQVLQAGHTTSAVWLRIAAGCQMHLFGWWLTSRRVATLVGLAPVIATCRMCADIHKAAA
jgi:hypothetical protein